MFMFRGIWRDLVHAGRSLAKAPGFTFVCVISLGIGMAPVIAIPYAARIFNMPPPIVNTEGLVELITTAVGPRPAANTWSYPDFADLRDADTGMAILGWAAETTEVLLPGRTETRASTLFVSRDYFETIGVALARGRGFDEAPEGSADAGPVVILGHAFWQDRLEADPQIIGTTLSLNGIPHVVVGIAPPLFEGHLGFQSKALFVPLEQHPLVLADRNMRFDRGREWVHLHGRLSAGVSVARASAAVSAVTAQLATQHAATNELKAGIAVPYDPAGSLARSEFRLLQVVAFTLTGMVLLVISLNVSGMMQVRSAIREKELSIRQAMGASRGRLVRYLLSEAIVMAGLGGALSSAVILSMPSVLSRVAAEPIPIQIQNALTPDLSIVAVSVGLCLLTSLVFGLLPATRFSRPVLLTALKDDAGGGGVRVGRVHRWTAALQVAIAVPLIVMSGITLDRVRSTATSDLGFEAELLYGAPLNLDAVTPVASVEDAESRIRRVRDTLAQASGVASVTVADGLPLDFRYRMTRVSLQVGADAAPAFISAHVTRVGDAYLDTMGIPMVRGRGFTGDDRAGATLVAIISKPLADTLFPDAADAGAEALGKRLIFGTDPRAQQTLTVVGVTADFPTSQMSTTREQLLIPLAQHPDLGWNAVAVSDDYDRGAYVMLIARSAPGEPPVRLTAAFENVLRELDPQFTRTSIVTGRWLRENSMNDFLTQSAVGGVSGGVILLLAALGIYGVVGLMVATRTREIAVRVALGASRRRVIRMVLFDVVKLVTPGVGVGLVLTAALMRLNSENMGIPLSEVETLAYVVGAAVAVLVAVLASLVPARRAASIQPMVAMKSA